MHLNSLYTATLFFLIWCTPSFCEDKNQTNSLAPAFRLNGTKTQDAFGTGKLAKALHFNRHVCCGITNSLPWVL